MDKLPTTIIQHIYEYDSTYKRSMFGKVLISLNVHCFIYRCDKCCRYYNGWYCDCKTCRTFLRFCKQLYFDPNSMTEDDTNDIVGLGF